MRRSFQRRKPVWLACAAGLSLFFGIGLPAGAMAAGTQPASQPEDPRDREIASLNEEVARLREQVQMLLRELEKARGRVLTLERQLAESRGEASPPGGNAGESAVDLDLPEDEPLASPETALAALRAEYDDRFPVFEPPVSERDRVNRLRSIRQWVPRANREFTGPFEWVCRVDKRETLKTGAVYLTATVIDPASGRARSEPHVFELSRLLASALDRLPDNEPIMIGGVFRTTLNINPEREDVGLFDDPPLVGPYVEFSYDMLVRSIAAVPNEPRRPADTSGGDTGAGG